MSKVFRQAQEAYRAGRQIEAANMLREALRREPNHAPSFHLLGIIEAKQSRFPIALKCFDAAVSFDPSNASYLVDRANVIASLGQPAEAVDAYERALRINPRLAEAHSNRSQALRLLGQREEALAGFNEAIALKPNFIDAHAFLGETLMEIGDFEGAIKAFTQTLLLNPAHIPVLLNRGTCQFNLRRWEKALKDFQSLVDLVPEHATAQARRAQCLYELDRYPLALATIERAMVLQPKDPECHLLRGKILSKLERFEEAMVDFEKATELGGDPASCFVARGATYMQLRQFDTALDYFDRGIRLNPNNAVWFYNRGCTLQSLRRHEEAIANFDEAIARDPTHAPSYWNSSLSYLALGDPKGWDHYEWRWKLEKGGPDKRQQPQGVTRWQGFEPLEGKHILLTSEQGLGDSIMFCRYAALVAERGAKVSLALPKGLVRTLARLPNIESILVRGKSQSLKGFDYYCPLLSLPKVFRTRVESIPFGSTAYLSADPELIARWRERLDAASGHDPRPRVGLMWSGRVVKALGLRSMSLETMLGVRHPGYQFISLQKEISATDRDLLREHDVLHFGDEQEDFADAAAMIELMDVVISIDTSIAHLSGALGHETWVALQFSAEWRWLLDRDDSPWYPKARLFRQPKQDDWEAVVERLRHALEARLSARS